MFFLSSCTTSDINNNNNNNNKKNTVRVIKCALSSYIIPVITRVLLINLPLKHHAKQLRCMYGHCRRLRRDLQWEVAADRRPFVTDAIATCTASGDILFATGVSSTVDATAVSAAAAIAVAINKRT